MSFLMQRFLSLRALLFTLWRAARLYTLNGSPRAFYQAFRFLWLRATRRMPPITASLAVTYRCPCRCPQCYADVEGRKACRELSADEARSALDEMKLLGTLMVIFTGGEPLLRPDIFEIISHARHIGLLTRMSTSGCSLTRAVAAELKRAGLNQCGISIDDVDPDRHDRLRRLRGAFARAVQGFGHLREFGLDRRMLVYASRAAVASGLERFIELGRKLKVNSYSFNIPFITGRLEETFEEALSENEMEILRRLRKCPSVSIEFPTPQTKCCAYDKLIIGLNPWGEVSPCPAVPFVMGSVREEPLADIWRRHVSALRLESKGGCPLNESRKRAQLIAHCDSVLAGGRSASRRV